MSPGFQSGVEQLEPPISFSKQMRRLARRRIIFCSERCHQFIVQERFVLPPIF